jgi:hypothetical protein
MNKPKFDKISVQIAAMALGVSFLSSGFAIYQWWTSGRDEKIRAAIEVSNKYTEEVIDPKQFGCYYKNVLERADAGQMSFLEVEKLEAPSRIRKHFERLEYISYLANRGKLDTNYLSQFVICGILNASDDLTHLKTLHRGHDDTGKKVFPELPNKLVETNRFIEQRRPYPFTAACPQPAKADAAQ